jgi:7-carboxy-7-deazaguanine synthase
MNMKSKDNSEPLTPILSLQTERGGKKPSCEDFAPLHTGGETLDITEIFRSLQGESTYAGLPCVFIRLAGCNLCCPWCDTDYSHVPGTTMPVEDVFSQVAKLAPDGLVEVTGGEPLLQEGVYPLLHGLRERGYTVLLESNGTVSLEKVPVEVIRIVDVKCPGSGGSFLPANLEQLLPGRDEVKFVLADRVDYDYAVDFAKNRLPAGLTVLFSAVIDRLPLERLADWMLEDRLPWRLQLQMHKFIGDPQPGGV